ncbi:MAG: GEVED domain-containing protein, partial [Anaerolineales bacterium]
TISGGSGTPQVFLDFGNGSGGFSGTLTEVTLRNSGGGALTMPLSAGINQVYFDVPGSTFGASTQPVAGRVRLSSAGGLTATGPAADGEVEDYIWNFGPTAITLTSLSASSAPARQAVALVLVAALAALIGLALLVRSRREMG